MQCGEVGSVGKTGWYLLVDGQFGWESATFSVCCRLIFGVGFAVGYLLGLGAGGLEFFFFWAGLLEILV